MPPNERWHCAPTPDLLGVPRQGSETGGHARLPDIKTLRQHAQPDATEARSTSPMWWLCMLTAVIDHDDSDSVCPRRQRTTSTHRNACKLGSNTMTYKRSIHVDDWAWCPSMQALCQHS